jgi:hypothetical protein
MVLSPPVCSLAFVMAHQQRLARGHSRCCVSRAEPADAPAVGGGAAPKQVRRIRASGISGGFQVYDDARPTVSLDGAQGLLEEALAEAGLAAHTAAIQRWCEEQGAAELGQVAEEVSELAEAVGLSESQTERLREALQATLVAEVARRERAEMNTRHAMVELGQAFLLLLLE